MESSNLCHRAYRRFFGETTFTISLTSDFTSFNEQLDTFCEAHLARVRMIAFLDPFDRLGRRVQLFHDDKAEAPHDESAW